MSLLSSEIFYIAPISCGNSNCSVADPEISNGGAKKKGGGRGYPKITEKVKITLDGKFWSKKGGGGQAPWLLL
jgi:hypothetical protein